MATADASRILVLGADDSAQRHVASALFRLSGAKFDDAARDAVLPLTLKTKYYEADVELHLHDVVGNELSTALLHDAEEYEAMLWVVDASSHRGFVDVQRFVEKSMEELSFDVSLLIATRVEDAVSASHLTALEDWCHENAFEFVPVQSDAESNQTGEGFAEKQGLERVLEALHCNMWRSMVMLPRDASGFKDQETASPQIAGHPEENQHDGDAAAETSAAEPAAETTKDAKETDEQQAAKPAAPESHEDRLQASLSALGPRDGDDGDDDMEMLGNLISQVRRIRETGHTLSDEERRRQAERVAMQLWNLMGVDDDDEE
ncbi:hypothetical protein ATCC90586_001371 [Pythium insidiosum]|nr:hypothetical protein ATCC90586_001371 [Pythium insidiosum]